MTHTPLVGTTYTPTINVETSFPRKVETFTPSKSGPAYARVYFRRVLKGGSLGELQSCYLSSWNPWLRKFKVVAENVRVAPPFNTQGKGLQFYARDSDGNWFYVNHANTWQGCPTPFGAEAERLHKGIQEIIRHTAPDGDMADAAVHDMLRVLIGEKT